MSTTTAGAIVDHDIETPPTCLRPHRALDAWQRRSRSSVTDNRTTLKRSDTARTFCLTVSVDLNDGRETSTSRSIHCEKRQVADKQVIRTSPSRLPEFKATKSVAGGNALKVSRQLSKTKTHFNIDVSTQSPDPSRVLRPF